MSGSQIVANINSLLAQKGISKKEFYEKCHITSASFSLWNKEKTKPRINNLAVIAEFLGVTLEDIIGEKEKNPAPKGAEVNLGYLELNAENRAFIDYMIEKLIKSQSEN